MKDSKNIWKYAFIVVLFAIAAFVIRVFVRYQSGWYAAVVPGNGYGESRVERKLGEVIGDELYNGEKRWRDGDWTPYGGIYIVVPQGVTIQHTINATITQGQLKYVVFNLGEGLTSAADGQRVTNHELGNCKRVYEQDITETGVYQIELSDLDPNAVYYASIMVTVDGNNEYSYVWRTTESSPRWYYIHDDKLAKLPFIHKKYSTAPNWE